MQLSSMKFQSSLIKFSNIMESVADRKIGIAVSGGGDSMALLHLASEWVKKSRREILTATVDHGLRPESKDEADFVKSISSELEFRHDILRWRNRSAGNMQNLARIARYDILAKWAKEKKIKIILLGHTLDDQIETVMLNLIRGSGVDGLRGMSETKVVNDVLFYRPLLSYSRDSLRSLLKSLQKPWLEDSSNFDTKYDRIKVRKLLSELKKEFNFDASRISLTASHMRRASKGLIGVTKETAERIIKVRSYGDVEIDVENFKSQEEEIQFRLLIAIFFWMSGNFYKPRFSDLEALSIAIIGDQVKSGRSLMGVIVSQKEERLVFRREAVAIKPIEIQHTKSFLWDHRWKLRLDLDLCSDLRVAILGDKNLSMLKKWKDFGIPRNALAVSPALYRKEKLLSAPLLMHGNSLSCTVVPSRKAFVSFFDRY